MKETTSAAPLVVFRVLFGLLMLISLVRFAALGWIEKLYLEPGFHFSFYGFGWVKPIGVWTYGLFVLCGLAAVGVMLGYRYRWSIVTFFLSFTYIELMDKTTYLNHYYLVSILAFLLIWLPAAGYFSLDARRRPDRFTNRVPRWAIDAIKVLLTIVYFYAGLAKLNTDWLVDAQPLATWLTTKDSIPLLGPLLRQSWMAYAFSWSGALYDLTIPFLLWYRPTRTYAFGAVIVFHLLTRILFPIGMFPYVMIVSTLIFFGSEVHEWIILNMRRVGAWLGRNTLAKRTPKTQLWMISSLREKTILGVLAIFFGLQLVLPFRHILYPGELFWTEEGFRFSWRVMLIEKAGYAQFQIVDPDGERQFYVDNGDFLNPFQEKQMAFQPDFILEYAHHLAEYYRAQGIAAPEVYVESYVALNGRPSRPFVDPRVDLAREKISLRHKNWLLPFGDEIKGF